MCCWMRMLILKMVENTFAKVTSNLLTRYCQFSHISEDNRMSEMKLAVICLVVMNV